MSTQNSGTESSPARPDTDVIAVETKSQSAFTRGVRWSLQNPTAQLVILVVLTVVMIALIPSFISRPQAFVALLVIASLLTMAAMGQTLVVILGGLDLAIAGYITFGAMVASNGTSRLEWSTPIALAVVIAVCGGFGALIGWLCHRYTIQPLVMTLGVGAMLTGGTMFLVNGDYTGTPPADLQVLTQLKSTTFGIPLPPVIFIVLLLGIILAIVLNKTAAGRRLYATGINPRAAGLTRIKTSAVWTIVFALSGVLAGIAGMLIASFGGGWSQNVGEPYLFTGLAAVLVGGTTFGSIRGSFTRTALGALILTVLSTIIVSQGLSEAQSRILYGVVILAVVVVYGRMKHVRDRF